MKAIDLMNYLFTSKDTAITISADIDQSQPRTKGDINYILIGDVGQTKESTLKRYL